LKLGNDAIQYQLDFSDQRNIGEQPVYLSADKIVFKGNPGLTVLHVPSYILCEFDRKITKHVKVKPVTGRPPSGFVFTDSITWSPREVEVSGPENAVKLLDELPTEAFIVDTPPESTQVIKKTINLALPDIVGLTVKPSVVQVSVGVEKVLERMLENCRVVPINIPEGRTVDIQPPTINITYRGAAGNLENLNPDSIRVVIDLKNKYHDFDEKLKAVVPEFRGVELVETQPEYFQAFIK
jgi:YbbR domain-containing protein